MTRTHLPNPNALPPQQRAPQPRKAPARTPGQRRPSPQRGSPILSALLLVVVGVVSLVVGAGTFLLIAPPVDALKAQAIAAVKASTGRDLTIAGPASLTVYPSLGIALQNVALSAPPEMGGAPTIAMESLEVSVKLLPLLRREVTIDRLVLKKPVFDLRVDSAGRKSWTVAVADAGAASAVRFAKARDSARDVDAAEAAILLSANDAGARTERAGNGGSALEELALGDVKIVDGSVRFSDERAGTTQQLDAINLQLALKSINSPLSAKGSLRWSGETVDLDASLSTVQSMLEEQPARVAAKITARPVAATYDGTMTLGQALALDGTFQAKSDSMRALARWFGQKLPRAKGFGPMSIDGKLTMAGAAITLSDADLALDGATAKGTLTVETSAARPVVRADLRMSELDLNKYMASRAKREVSDRGRSAAPEGGTDGATPTGSGKATSIEDLIQQPGPKVKGYVQRAGWSEEPMDLEILSLVDADAKLVLGGLLFQDIKVGQSQLAVALKGSVLRADFVEVQLYDGKGRGFVTVDATGDAAAIGANLAVDGVAAQGFLKDAVEVDWLSGTGKLTVAVSGQGQSQRQLVDTLNGKADLSFSDGAITGFNLAQAMRGLSQGQLSSLKSGATEKTDFSELSATFNIVNGVAQNDDLKLASPLLRVGGAGRVLLPSQSLDYLAKPRLVASLTGQGGERQDGGLEIPVKIEGPWAKPSIKPDISGLLKDPSKAVEAAKELGKKLKGKNADELIRGVLGGAGKSKSSLGQYLGR